jgi:hypothetical protein
VADTAPNLMPRRRLLIASVPLVLLSTGCRSADLFAGPDPLGGRPPLAHDTVVLQDAIAAELDLISRYKSVISTSSEPILPALLAQHQQHLAQLKARLIVPAGAQQTASPAASPAASPSASSAPAPAAHPVDGLRDAELASAASLTARLVSVQPSLAQLFASIAASDASHANALGSS